MEKLGGVERAAVGVLTGHRGLQRTETAFSAADASLCNQNCFKGANNLISISQPLPLSARAFVARVSISLLFLGEL